MLFKTLCMRLRFIFSVITIVLFSQFAIAGETALLFGTNQPLLFKGYNVEIQYMTDNWVFEYSHGWELKLHEFKDSMTKEEVDQNLKIRLPWTTGGGVGYRITKAFHAALEYKVHEFDVNHPTDASFKYQTQTLGIGFYYSWKPFADKGFTIVPAIRYWPTIANNLSGGKKVFSNGEVHEPHKFDFAPNIKVGWTF